MSQNKGFRHFRNLAKPGQKHLINNKGGVTMAFESPKHINDLDSNDKVKIAFSFCSSDDNFQREAGRTGAEERLVGATVAIPGDEFQRLLHAVTARDLLQPTLLSGLDADTARAFRSRVKRSLTRA